MWQCAYLIWELKLAYQHLFVRMFIFIATVCGRRPCASKCRTRNDEDSMCQCVHLRFVLSFEHILVSKQPPSYSLLAFHHLYPFLIHLTRTATTICHWSFGPCPYPGDLVGLKGDTGSHQRSLAVSGPAPLAWRWSQQ